MAGASFSSRVLTLRDGAAVDVRPLTSRETAGLARFAASLSPASRAFFLPHAYDDATLARHVARNARGSDLSLVTAAGPEIVGYAFLWEFDLRFPLLGLGVADAWQGRGLGSALLDLLIAEARAADREGIELTTVPDNIRARHLYEGRGFRVTGEVDNVAGDGRVVRELRMSLTFRPGTISQRRLFSPPQVSRAAPA
jgi:ribosomal protein S18 acetylase RimI-like enzyme